MRLNVLLGVLTGYGLGILAIVGGVYQLYVAVFGPHEKLSLGRFRIVLQPLDLAENTAARRVFWIIAGCLTILGGFAFLGRMTFALLF